MNVEKELISLEKDQEHLLAKYGRKFKCVYDNTINRIVRGDKEIVALDKKRRDSIDLADELMAALAITETEV